MKAVHVHEFGPPEVMRLEEVPDPQPGPGQVLVRVHAAGVNPVDTYIRAGLYANKPSLPFTPGFDTAGVVESVGEKVSGVNVGDRVYTAGTVTGGYAERAVCDASAVHPLPTQVTFAQGACINVPYATAYRALFGCARAMPGEVVFIHGASGGVGVAAVQLARTAGMTVIGTAGSELGRKLVVEQGAHHALDHRTTDYLSQAVKLTRDRGVDVVLEMRAHVNLEKDLGILAQNGRIVVIGSRGKVEIDPRDAMVRDASIIGMLLFNLSERESATIHAALVAGLEKGKLRPVVRHELPLAQAARAHHMVMEPGAYGKIVLVP
jgi:NADPH2:quinone reductase